MFLKISAQFVVTLVFHANNFVKLLGIEENYIFSSIVSKLLKKVSKLKPLGCLFTAVEVLEPMMMMMMMMEGVIK